jgi:hypothetical protein
MRSRIIVVAAAVSVLFTAGIASASGEETDPRVDTRFTYGYDAEAQLFFTSIQATDTQATETSTLDCTLNGELTATYGTADEEDGTIPVTGLMAGTDAVTFTSTDPGDETEAAEDPIAYSAEGECGIFGVAVGSQGHINHGQFMKLFKQLFDVQGRGCLNRLLAQSDLGKDDQQVKTQDFEEPALRDDGTFEDATIDFTTVEANCNRDKKEKPEDHPGRGHKKTDEATDADEDQGGGRPDSPGKSDKAPGHKKDK